MHVITACEQAEMLLPWRTKVRKVAVEDWDRDPEGTRETHHIPTNEAWDYRIIDPTHGAPDPHTWGEFGDEMYDRDWLRKDINKKGVQKPVNIITDGINGAHIDDGNHRAQLAQELGHSHVPANIMMVPSTEYYSYWENNRENRLDGQAGSHQIGPGLQNALNNWYKTPAGSAWHGENVKGQQKWMTDDDDDNWGYS